MLRVLIVEDRPEKAERLIAIVKEAIGERTGEVEVSPDLVSARRMLRKHRFDLLLLDVQLPQRIGRAAEPLAGINFLNEILESDSYIRPFDIIGITAYDEIIEKQAHVFASNLFALIKYEAHSSEWETALISRVEYACAAREMAEALGTEKYNFDLAVITALDDPEFTAVLDLPVQWEEAKIAGDGDIYRVANFSGPHGSLRVVACRCPRMGMPTAAVMAMKVIENFRPRFIAMVGICAGIKGKVSLGDIVIADPSWDYGSGKHQVVDGSPEFLPAPHQINLNVDIRSLLVEMKRDEANLDAIKRRWKNGNSPESKVTVHIAPVASGSAVLADSNMAVGIQKQHRKVAGIEMENYGVMLAAELCSRPRPIAFTIKAVTDFADEEKGDNYQGYGAFVSANFLFEFVTRYLIKSMP